MLENVPARRIVKMKRRTPVIEREAYDRVHTILDRIEIFSATDYLIGLFRNYRLDQGREVRVMVVKRIPVDAAVTDDILDGYL